MKISIWKSYHEDIVNELLSELDKGGECTPTLKDSLGVICNRSVQWMWNAYQALSNKELVSKVG